MKRHPARGAPLAILALLMAAGFPLTVGAQVAVVGGSIHPAAIEVDNNSNHFPASAYPTGFSNGLILNAGAAADWVKDIANNTDPPSLSSSIATGIDPTGASTGGVPTGAPGGKGHWNGARVVDGIGGGDQDIFLTGGKENDVTTWNIGPGTVGSSKYDASQAYLANNQTHVFFGMERRGNNGTTAFDFEFNKLPPLTEAQLLALGFSPAQAAALKDLIPNRSVGDTLCTFEMQGSGGSGSAVPFIFRWNGTAYVEDPTLLAGVFTSINDGGPNDTNAVPSPPWGHVNSKGVWDLSNLQRFEFAEAAVPLSVLGTSGCGGAAFVQIRTRSSSTENSDLKDTTKVFQFVFGGPTAAATLGTNCLQQFTFDGSTSTNSTGGSTGLTYQWTFTVSPATATLGAPAVATATPGVYTATGVSGTVPVTSGVAATVTAQLKVVEGGTGGCEDSLDTALNVTVYPILTVAATLTTSCAGTDNPTGRTFTFSANAAGGNPPYSYAWVFKDGNGVQVGTSSAASGSFTPTVAGAYSAQVTVTDTAVTNGKPQCSATDTKNINVYDKLTAVAALTTNCFDQTNNPTGRTFTYDVTVTGGKTPYSYAWVFKDGNGVQVGMSGDKSGSFTPTTAGAYTAEVTVTDTADGATGGKPACIASDTKNINVYDKLTAVAALTTNCFDQTSNPTGRTFTYDVTVTGGKTPYTYAWVFRDANGVQVGISSAKSGSFTPMVAGAYSAQVTVTDAADGAAGGKPQCQATDTKNINVYDKLTAVAALTTNCFDETNNPTGRTFTYDVTVTGGKTPYSYAWVFKDANGVQVGTSSDKSGSFTPTVAGAYSAQVTVTDTADGAAGGKPQCQATDTKNINVYDKLAVTASLSVDCDGKLSFDATPSGGKAPYTYAWSIERNVSGMWVQVTTSTSKGGTFTVTVDGDYRAVVTVTDTADGAAGGKPQCQAIGTSPTVAAALPLNPIVTKGLPAPEGTAVTMNGSAHAADSVVWQVRDADTSTSQGAQPGPWITLKTDPNSANDLYSLLYGSFKTHDTTPTAINFVFEGVPYTGRKYEVEIRISGSRTLNGVLCSADSAPVKISYIEAVDPKRGRQLKRVQ